MIPRVMTALVGIPLLILIIGMGRPWHFSLLVLLAAAGALWEYFSMVFPYRRKERYLGILLGVVVSLGMVFPRSFPPGSALALAVVGAFVIYLFFRTELEERYRQLGWTLLGIVYVGYLLPHLVLLFQSPHGREWIFFILLVIMAGDTAAYFVGRSLGRKKLSPRLSPNKTVEGAWASAGASILAGVVGGRFLLPALSWLEIVLFALFLNLLGQSGDLFESWIKRVFAVKESGTLLPGHGGLLDRMDSLMFPVVFTVYYVRWVHS